MSIKEKLSNLRAWMGLDFKIYWNMADAKTYCIALCTN